MIEGTRSQYGDSDTVRFCAFSFPGVLLTLGSGKWNDLQSVYFTLTQDLQVDRLYCSNWIYFIEYYICFFSGKLEELFLILFMK